MIQNKAAAQYRLSVRNRPGELLKLTRFLSDSGVDVSALRVASYGNTASIQFATPQDCVLPARLRKARI